MPWTRSLAGEMIREVHLEHSTWNRLPHKFEAGTMNIAQAVGLGAAVDYLDALGMENVREHERRLGEYAYRALRDWRYHRLRPREGPNGPHLLLSAGRASARPLPAPGRGGRSHKERPPLRPATDAPPRRRSDGSGELLPLQHRGRGGRSAYGARTCPPVPRSVGKMSMMRELYTQILMDHYRRPRNRGELENHDLDLLNPSAAMR